MSNPPYNQWRCPKCNAIRKKPHRFICNSESLIAVIGAPCKRCGSRAEANADCDPWLDIDEDDGSPSLAGKVA